MIVHPRAVQHSPSKEEIVAQACTLMSGDLDYYRLAYVTDVCYASVEIMIIPAPRTISQQFIRRPRAHTRLHLKDAGKRDVEAVSMT